MAERYDAVIIGAGPGGLTCAGVLAKEGLRVIVVDPNANPGGTARAYQRRGFSFPCGPLGFSRVQARPGGPTGAPVCRRVRYSVRTPGFEAPISLPFDALAGRLAEIFPFERKGIGGFFSEARAVNEALRAAPEGETPVLGEWSRAHASEVLRHLVGDGDLIRLLGAMGTGEPGSGFPLLARMWELMCENGIWYPEGGFNRFCGRLAQAVTSAGGLLKMRSLATRVIVENGRARGVLLSDGTLLEAGAVVSNADFKRTFLDLVEARAQPPEWRSAVRDARETSSNLQVALGVEAAKVNLGAFSWASRLIFRSGERRPPPEWRSAEVDPRALAAQELEVALWSAEDNSLAPPGGAVVVIRAAADHGHFARFRPRRAKRSRDYSGYKTALARALVDEVEPLLPGLGDAVLVSDVATPLTFEDRAGRYSGAVAGWSQRHSDVEEYTVRPLVLTPVAGLFMAGYQAFSWLYYGGVPTAIISGELAAASLLRGVGPVSDVMIPRRPHPGNEESGPMR